MADWKSLDHVPKNLLNVNFVNTVDIKKYVACVLDVKIVFIFEDCGNDFSF